MAKIKTAAEVNAFQYDTVDKLVGKIKAVIKKNGGRIGHISIDDEGKGTWSIGIENNMHAGLIARDLLQPHPTLTLVKTMEHKGHYDWDADVYIKDQSCIFVTF